MGYRLRTFIRTSSGEIRRLPFAKYERLLDRDPTTLIPEFAGKEMRTALVILQVDGGRVVETMLADTLKIKVNRRGQISKRWHDRLDRLSREAIGAHVSELFEGTTSQHAKVVSSRSRFLKRRVDQEFRWKPTKGEVSEMFRLALSS